jgi:hypothetical protein
MDFPCFDFGTVHSNTKTKPELPTVSSLFRLNAGWPSSMVRRFWLQQADSKSVKSHC